MNNLQVSIQSGDSLDVRQFSVEAAMNSPYEIEILAVSSSQAIDFDKVIGASATFALSRTRMRGHESEPFEDNDAKRMSVWHGICSEMRQVRAESTGLATYRLRIVPDLWLLGHRSNNRIYQYLSEIEIVLQLLKEWGIEPEVRVDLKAHKKRKYKVQYEETDLDFVHRMLEECGVAYYFSSDEGPTEVNNMSRMVLVEYPQRAAPREPSLVYHDQPLRSSELAFATSVEIVRRVAPGRYTLRDHDYRKPPSYSLLATSNEGVSAEQKLEIFDYVEGAFLYCNEPGDGASMADRKGKTRTDEIEGRSLAQKRLHALRASASIASFETNAFDLGVGSVVGIANHPRLELESDRLLLTSVHLSGGTQSEWSFVAEGVNAKHEYRPPLRTPRPIVNGVESATVVGAAGEEIHCDEFGRVKVHFHWDRQSKMDDDSTCWIHVSQAWGGALYGGMHLPRVGQEVMVEFLGGDPDRPVISGRLYTALQQPAYALPQHKTRTVVSRTNSTGGTGGYNELMFEDKASSELMHTQAQRDRQTIVKRNSSTSIYGAEVRFIGGSRSTKITKNEVLAVGVDLNVTVGGNRQEAVDGSSIFSAKKHISMDATESMSLHAQQTSIVGETGVLLATGPCPPASKIVIHPNGIIISAPNVLINPSDEESEALLNNNLNPAQLAEQKKNADDAAKRKADEAAATKANNEQEQRYREMREKNNQGDRSGRF